MYPFDGIFDIHTHAAPDITARSLDVIEVAKLYRDRGFRGMLYMNHYDNSVLLASLAARHVPGFEIYGGLVLNPLIGGLNKLAVEHTAKVAPGVCKIIYMPTVHSEYDVRMGNVSARPFTSISRDGALLPETYDMLDLIAMLGLVLSTGHSSPEEILLLSRAAQERGIPVLATNPMPQDMTVKQMCAAADAGAYIEWIYYSASPSRRGGPPHTMDEYAAAIKAIGPERCILSSCGGQGWMPIHTYAWEELIASMLERGLSQDEVDQMCKVNPVQLLGLEV